MKYKEAVMKSKIALFLPFVTFTAVMTLAPFQAGQAGVAERPSLAAPAPADDNGCGDAGDYGMTDTIVPSLAVQICDDCRFDERDRFALLMSYGHAARRAGYLVDPLNTNVFLITEISVLPNGKPYLKGVIGNKQLTVGDPFPGETLASVAGKLALIAVAGDR
jgi:hypothetical protein